jgi:hypothetical protein
VRSLAIRKRDRLLIPIASHRGPLPDCEQTSADIRGVHLPRYVKQQTADTPQQRGGRGFAANLNGSIESVDRVTQRVWQ